MLFCFAIVSVKDVGSIRFTLMSSKMQNVVRWLMLLEDTDCGS